MKAAQVTQAGAGEAAEMQQEAGEAMATQQGARGVAKTRIRARIALAILESAEALDHASAIVDRLDGAYIHDDDWDEEGLPWLSWVGKRTPTPGGDPSPRGQADAHDSAPTSCGRGRGCFAWSWRPGGGWAVWPLLAGHAVLIAVQTWAVAGVSPIEGGCSSLSSLGAARERSRGRGRRGSGFVGDGLGLLHGRFRLRLRFGLHRSRCGLGCGCCFLRCG